MKSTAKAHTNIALIKYWGKRDKELFLPMNSSLSLTLDAYYTTTTVEFREVLREDLFSLDGDVASEVETIKLSRFLDKIRGEAKSFLKAEITSTNHVPIAAGYASSASGYAALAGAATQALSLTMDEVSLSRMARQGSGSACRSIYGGFVKWEKGSHADGSDSYAYQVLPERDWLITVLSVQVSNESKAVSSRDGMERTVKTSPFYKGWLESVETDMDIAMAAIEHRDFRALGEVAEANALKMHGTMLGAKPPLIYWNQGTVAVMDEVHRLRQQGLEVYFTIDAGPNVKVLCLPRDEDFIRKEMLKLLLVQNVLICHPGPGLKYG